MSSGQYRQLPCADCGSLSPVVGQAAVEYLCAACSPDGVPSCRTHLRGRWAAEPASHARVDPPDAGRTAVTRLGARRGHPLTGLFVLSLLITAIVSAGTRIEVGAPFSVRRATEVVLHLLLVCLVFAVVMALHLLRTGVAAAWARGRLRPRRTGAWPWWLLWLAALARLFRPQGRSGRRGPSWFAHLRRSRVLLRGLRRLVSGSTVRPHGRWVPGRSGSEHSHDVGRDTSRNPGGPARSPVDGTAARTAEAAPGASMGSQPQSTTGSAAAGSSGTPGAATPAAESATEAPGRAAHPPQLSASVWPLVTRPGLPVHLSWQSTGADEVRLVLSGERLPSSGSRDVALANSGALVLEAVNGAGCVVARTAHVVVVSEAAPTLRLARPPSALMSTDDLRVGDGPATHALGSLTHAWRQGAVSTAGASPQPPAAGGDEHPPSAAEQEGTGSPAEPPSAEGLAPLAPPSPFPAPAAFRPVEVRPTASLRVDDAGRVPLRPSTQDVS